MILSLAFLLLQAPKAQPPKTTPEPMGDDVRIVAVEQKGKPPYTPEEGRVYRLGGALSNVRAGDLLVIKRPGVAREIGLLRVNSVHGSVTAVATLEVHGETFPLKGDLAVPLPLRDIPEINPTETNALKLGIPIPLNPLVIPSIPSNGTEAVKIALQPSRPKALEEIALQTPLSPNQWTLRQPNMPKFMEQQPLYFLENSTEISPKGIEKLKEWTQAWGKTGLKYFLAVPQKQLHMEQLVVQRLAALQRALQNLGIASVEYRTDERNFPEPYDVIYVGVED
jgi:hypothetical protein